MFELGTLDVGVVTITFVLVTYILDVAIVNHVYLPKRGKRNKKDQFIVLTVD